jgi:hypothetical protein
MRGQLSPFVLFAAVACGIVLGMITDAGSQETGRGPTDVRENMTGAYGPGWLIRCWAKDPRGSRSGPAAGRTLMRGDPWRVSEYGSAWRRSIWVEYRRCR